MPQLGDIRKHSKEYPSTSIWHACIDCGKEAWVRRVNGQPYHLRCVTCANRLKIRYGADNNLWRGGKSRFANGYIRIRLQPNDFFYPMTITKGEVAEHRLVMAKHIGRCLQRWEIVHHKNHIKTDNRIENLQLVTDDRHKQITILEMQITQLQKENKSLREKLAQYA